MDNLQLSRLLACLYRAPLDESGWQEFLDYLSEMTGAVGGSFLHHDMVRQQFTMRAVGGAQKDSAVQKAYNDHFGAVDPYRAPYMALKTEAVMAGHALVPDEQMRRTEFYNDLLLPSGIAHPIILPGIIDPKQTDTFSLWWSKQSGPPGDEVMKLLELLQPHVKLSLQTLRALSGIGQRAISSDLHRGTSAEAVLDQMPQAVFLLNEQLLVEYFNRAAEHMLHHSDAITLTSHRLCVNNAIQVEFDQALGNALHHAQGNLDARQVGMRMIGLRRAPGRRDLPTRILPLRIDKETPAAHVLVVMHDAARLPTVSLDTMRALFGATPTEVAIANGLLAGQTVAEIAQKRRISEDTTRSHLKMLFQRTNTGRQSELVLLLLGLPRTLADTLTL